VSLKRRIAIRLDCYRRCAVWGAGGLGRTALRKWLPAGKVELVIDTNLAGNMMPGSAIPVVAPEELPGAEVDVVIVCSSAYLEIADQLRNLGYTGDYIYIYELFLPKAGKQGLGDLACLGIDIAATKNEWWLPFLFRKPQIFINVTFRVGNWLQKLPYLMPLYWLMFALHHTMCVILSIQLPLRTRIGPGLVFAHFGTIVFTQRAQVGAFFTIYHGCTVGTNDSGGSPVIGSFVCQYAGAHVLGDCQIGSHSRIGANAVVLDEKCEDGSTLVGLPARVVQVRQWSSKDGAE
jgi:serine O-acetyltransferase